MENFMPVLSKGSHIKPSQGACVMEMVSFLAGEEWSDTPDCSNRRITIAAQLVNDNVENRNRHLILKDFDRLFNTALSVEDDTKFALALADYFGAPPNSIIIELSGSKLKQVEKNDSFEDLIDFKMLDTLTKILNVYDEVFGRKDVKSQDLNPLKALKIGS